MSPSWKNEWALQGVANGSLTVGDAVLFITMVQQLSAPLNWFGSYYRQIQGVLGSCSCLLPAHASALLPQQSPFAGAPAFLVH